MRFRYGHANKCPSWLAIIQRQNIQSILFANFVSIVLALGFVATTFSAHASPPTGVGQRVVTTGDANVRYSAGGTYKGEQPAGALGTTTHGPVDVSLSGTVYTWFNVNFDSGTDGWVADINLEVYQEPEQPDLIVQSVTASPSPVEPGATMSIGFTIRNQGSGDAVETQSVIRFVQSNSLCPKPNLDTINVGAISSGNSRSYTRTLTAPTTPGTYYACVFADNLNEANQSNEDNDVGYSASFRVEEPDQPDLIVQSVTASPSPVEPGATMSIGFTIRNQGSGDAVETQSVIRFVQSNSLCPKPNLDTINVGAISSGNSRSYTRTLAAPTTVGTYYACVFADNLNEANQSDEDNDVGYSAAFSVQDVSLLPPPTLSAPLNDASGVATTPTFSWSNVTGANRYWLLVATSAADMPTDPLLGSCPNCVVSGSTGDTSYTPPNSFPYDGKTATLNHNTTYFWKVQGWNSSGPQSGNFSSTRSFTTGSPPVGTVDIEPRSVTLSGNNVAPGEVLGVSWLIKNNGTATAGTSNSQVRITSSNASDGWGDPSDNVGNPQATGSISAGATIVQSTSVTAPTAPGTYYAWVIADNNDPPLLTQTDTGNDYAVSNAFTVGTNSAPVITNISPPTMAASAGEQLITIHGSNFTPGASGGGKLVFTDPGGEIYYTTAHPDRIEFVTESQWGYRIINDGHVGSWTVQVVNADGKVSNQETFNVESAAGGRSIQGSLTLYGNALQSVSVSLTGAASSQVVTGVNGSYIFSGLSDGQYSITPSQAGYQFSPVSSSISLDGFDKQNVNFRACNPSTPLTVRLQDPNGQPLTGASVSAAGTSGVEGATGSYTVSGLGCVSGEITTTLDGQTRRSSFDRFDGETRTITLNLESAVSGTPPNNELFGDPVNTATGNYVYQRRDLEIPGIGMPFTFERTYNSRDASLVGAPPAPMGFGWTHNFNVHLVVDSEVVTITWGDGHTESYAPDGTGGYTPPFGIFSTLIDNGDGTFTLTKRNRTAYQFDVDGHLVSITDKNGNSIDMLYTGANLTHISDTAGRSIQLSYDPSGRIILITDPISRTVEYAYDLNGDLISATDPQNQMTDYTYDADHQMLTIIDPRGNTVIDNTYDSINRVVTYQLDAKGNETWYDYQKDVGITTITDALDHVTIHYHDSYLRLVKKEDARGGIELFEYDSFGNRVQVTDKNGNVTQYGYDDRGNVISKTDALGNVTKISYDANDNPLSRTDALGNVTRFDYDSNGNLIRTTDALDNFTEITYLPNGLPEKTRDALGNITTNAFDSDGNLEQVTDALSKITRFTYDGVGRRRSETDALSHSTYYDYDNNDNLITVTDAASNTTHHSYDENNNRKTTTDRNGNITTWNYDEKDLLIGEVDALTHEETYAYDKLDRRVSLTDRRGYTTQFVYDEVGNLIEVIDPLLNKTIHSYDLNGNRLSTKDARGHSTFYEYDALNRRTKVKDHLGNETVTEYDELGRIKLVEAPGPRITRNTYDNLGRLTEIEDPEGGLTKYSYDPNGNRESMTDPENKVTQYAYDPLNRLEVVTDALNHQQQISYDDVGNRESETDALSHTTSFTYDALNRQIEKIDALGHTTTTIYDPEGRVESITDANNETTSFEYDKADRLITVTDAADGKVRYTYDETGNRLSMLDPNGNLTEYTYDELNRRLSMTEPLLHVTYFEYDEVGNLSQKTDPKGQVIRYSYEERNLRTGIDYPSQPDVTFSFDEVGNLEIMIDGLGTTTHSYDLLNRRTSTIDPFGNEVGYEYYANNLRKTLIYPGGKPVSYEYDLANRLVKVTDWLGNATNYGYDDANRLVSTLNANGTTTTYGYDNADRLTSLVNAMSDTSVINSYAYVLDPVGNHVSEDRNEPLSPVLFDDVVDDTHDAENRLVSSNGIVNSFDSNGNMLTKGANGYSYDAADRLIETNISGVQTQYQYDGLGNRYVRTRNGETTRFVLETNTELTNVLVETDILGNPQAYNIYGKGLILRIPVDSNVLQYHYDLRGNTITVTDNSATILSQYAYDPFGQVLNSRQTKSNPFGFLGQYGVFDEGDNLSYIRARYYDTNRQRFISKDLLFGEDQFPQSLNRYSYSLNSPVRLVDISGLSAEKIPSSALEEPLHIRNSYLVDIKPSHFVKTKVCLGLVCEERIFGRDSDGVGYFVSKSSWGFSFGASASYGFDNTVENGTRHSLGLVELDAGAIGASLKRERDYSKPKGEWDLSASVTGGPAYVKFSNDKSEAGLKVSTGVTVYDNALTIKIEDEAVFYKLWLDLGLAPSESMSSGGGGSW